ncbi:MAG: Nif3-like dinuclear metal center hexameric protein [Oscillospiraceae bacterium]
MLDNKRVLDALFDAAPESGAEEWDNVGLIVDCGNEYDSVLVALDLTFPVISEAESLGCGAVVCHHPAIFHGIKCISKNDPVFEAVKKGISVFAAHTNFDNADPGVNTVLADLLSLEDVAPLGDQPTGKMGSVPETSALKFAEKVKEALGVSFVEVADAGRPVKKVAVIGGSGGSMYRTALEAGCDLLVTGECRHNEAIEAVDNGLSIISAGHFETESPSMQLLRDMLADRLPDARIILSSASASPFKRV